MSNGKSKSKPHAMPLDRACPTIRKPMVTDTQIVAVTRNLTTVMQSSPSWATATDVQAAVKVWNEEADAIEAHDKAITDLAHQMKATFARLEAHRRNARAAKKQVLGAVAVFCNGSIDMVMGMGCDVIARAARGELAAMVDMTTSAGKASGESTLMWPRGLAANGFLVQHATDIANEATYSAPTACTKTTFTLGGSPSGSTVHFRIAAIDPASKTGQSPWSAWIAATVR